MRGIWVVAVVLAVASCTGEAGSPPPAASSSWRTAKPPADCVVTRSQSDVVPPAPIEPTSKPVVWAGDWYGNDALWVRLSPTGVVPADAGLDVKFPWWRAVAGRLTVTGRPVGGGPGTMTPHVFDGYGDRGFQVTGLVFAAPGCWSITGQVRDETLTVVVWIQAFDRF